MYIDPIVFYSLFALASLPALACGVLAVIINNGRTVGGLTFCRMGRIGFSFYVRAAAPRFQITLN